MNAGWNGLGQAEAVEASWSIASNPTRQDVWQPKGRDGGEMGR